MRRRARRWAPSRHRPVGVRSHVKLLRSATLLCLSSVNAACMGGNSVRRLGSDGFRTRPADHGELQQEARKKLDLVGLKLLVAKLEGIRMTPARVTDRRC